MKIFSEFSDVWQAYQKKPWKLRKPEVLQFPVNDVCDSRCQMCRVWEQKKDFCIDPDQIVAILSNPLFSKVSSVGINGGEPTLRQDLPELVQALFDSLPKLSNISLITNGLNSSRVIERVKDVSRVVRRSSGRLNLMVSLDGVEGVHDRVRGRVGCFENAVDVIDAFNGSDLIDGLRLGCTVIRENVYGLHDLIDFALGKGVPIKYRLGIPHKRLYSEGDSLPFALTFEERVHFAVFLESLIRFYEKSDQQCEFYRSLIAQMMYDAPRRTGCDWQHRGATLSSRGELFYCAVQSDSLGSALERDPARLYFGKQGQLKDIVEKKCDRCVHDYTGLPDGRSILKADLKRLLKKTGFPLQAIKQHPSLDGLKYVRAKRTFRAEMEALGLTSKTLANTEPALLFKAPLSEKRRVLICGWYGTETLGDKAILGGVFEAIRSYWGKIELHIASFEPYISEMTKGQMPELDGCSIHPVSEAIGQAASMDLVVFGGGPLMAIDNLAPMIAIFQKAAEAKVPTLVAGCGVGPMGDAFLNDAVRQLLNLASLRIYRDQKSLQAAQSLGIDVSMDRVTEDPAFTWLKTNAPVVSKAPRKLLIGLRDWPFHQYAFGMTEQEAEKLKEHYEREIVEVLERLFDRFPDLSILPFPMCTNHRGWDDRWFYRRLFKGNLKLKEFLDTSLLAKELAPDEAAAIFKTASAALTMRFHSLVFALGLGVPAVAIDYTLGGKVNSLASKHGVPFCRFDSLNGDFLLEQLSLALEKTDVPKIEPTFASSVRAALATLEPKRES